MPRAVTLLLLPAASALLLPSVAPRVHHFPHRASTPRCAEEELELGPKVTIEYCTRCNWMLRSAWLQQELLTTFNGTLAEVALRPNHNKGGIFVCTLYTVEGNNKVSYTLWDRAEAEAFPEAKVLKQRVRDVIDPGKSLGHSDGEEAPKARSGRKAFQRLLSAVLGDRSRRGDVRDRK